MVFHLLFFQIKEIYNATPPKQYVVLQILQEDKVIDFSKRALHAGPARNKWLKYILHSDRKLKLRKMFFKKTILSNCFPFLLIFFINAITPVISSFQIACDAMYE